MVGGRLTTIDEVPWQVAVEAEFEVTGIKIPILCGGSIIDLDDILTAGHCVFDPATETPLAATSFHVVAGASSIEPKEIEKSATAEVRKVGATRIHPYFQFAAGPGTPDDVAVLQLAEPLKESSAVKPIGLPTSASNPPEGTQVSLSGYGEENPLTEELNEKLYSIGMTLVFPRTCGRQADALFLCASNASGSACFGDSGGGVVEGSPPTLVGVVDIVEELCNRGGVNGFVNLAAPEVRDFIEGNETPPLAPRGGGAEIRGVTVAGHSLSCEPGSWSNGPTFTYSFIANNQVLQQGSSPTYALSSADIGRAISCEVQATNAGGTGIARTEALAPVRPAPVVSLVPIVSPSPSPGNSPAASANEQGVGESGSAPSSSSITAAQIASLLRQELTPAGKAAKIAALLQARGFTVTFRALEAGTAVIDWYQLPLGAKLAKKSKAKPILVASSHLTFQAPETKRMKIKLTAAGQRLLKSTSSVKLTAKGTFTPTGKPPVTATRVFVLKR